MERYRFSEQERALMEGMKVPFAVFQLVDERIATLVVSDGFCEMCGTKDRARVYAAMDHDTYKNVHPDDIARLGNAVFRFMKESGRFESVYRLKNPKGPGHIVVHAYGEHVYAEDGTRLAQIWYADEGVYNSEENRDGTPLSRSLSNALHEESILRASYYDYLTGLPSMTYFFELAEAGKEAIRKSGGNPVLMYMDFSGMKFYNSKHGFAEGDNLLRSFARILIRLFGLDRCCRIAADHFAVQAEEAGLDEKLRILFEECRSINNGKTLPVHVGVYPAQSEKVHISIECDRAKLACTALSGRYEMAVNYYSQDLREGAEKKQYIIENFDRALEEKWIRVYYQPIVRAINGKVCDEEALARWIDPARGFISPADFIPVLEDARLIYRLDLYVLEQVLEKMKLQARTNLHIVPHSINLSRFDFNACDIVEEIRKRVDASGVGRDKITIEITESVIGTDFEFMKAQVEHFRSLGFPVWMDDFGSGYSSLDVLQSIKFDLIKFDMSFMRRLDESDSARTILTELMKMATALGVDTVCEGVETEEQVHFLQEIGCSKLQGFYFCKAIPLEEIIERNRRGTQIGYEDPAASAYFEAIGRVNLYDLAVIANGDDAALQNAFTTLPIGILEVCGDKARYVRSSQSYREFMARFFNFDVKSQVVDLNDAPMGFNPTFMKATRQCCDEGSRLFIDEVMPDGSRVHTFVRRIGTNPVNGSVAIAIAVLSIREPNDGMQVEQILSVIEQFGEHMPGGFFVYKADEKQELLYANRAVCQIYGCDSLEEFKAFTGFTFRGMVHPEDYDRVRAAIKNQMQDSQAELDFVEYRIIRKDGGIRWIDDYGHYMQYDANNGLHYVFISDITHKHELAESDKAMRSAVIEALTKAYDSVWLIDDIETQRFELYRIDKEMEHLMPAHVAVKIERFSEAFAFYSRLVLEEDRQRFMEAVRPEVIASNVEKMLIYSIPFRRVFDDGIRYYRLEFAKLDLPGGKTGIVGGFKNVDEEVRRDQKLQHSLALRSAVIEALTKAYDSVWLINDMETQHFELFRIDEKLVHQIPANTAVKLERFSDAFAFYSRLVLEEDRQAFLEAVSPGNIIKNTEDKVIYSVPFRRVFESGVRYYRVEFAKLDLGNGEVNIVTGFKDVDDEVRKDRQIQRALREAIDAANASNRAKSDFLSSMSHDMRTPMNGIIGMTTIAANHLDDRERVADCLKKISDSSKHLLSLINDVLDMNKIESGKVELHEEEFCLAELIDGMLAMTRPQIQAHGHSFRANVNVEHEQLIGDSRRIEQVFVNIMSNAIKYTPDGGRISLTVRETPTRTQGFGHYQFIFEDNGYGMTEEFQKQLFEPFARANDKQTAGIQGTGLGMAITRNIVRMMGGDITVESAYGEGSKFTVSMYLKLQNTGDIDYGSFVDLRVLVADDDPVCCESTCEILGGMGMNSEWVLSGKAAVERVKARLEQGRDFFAVIVDWKLPDQGGVETTRQIRQLVGKDVPIIIFSAYDWSEIEQEAREAGATAFISKPLFRTKLATLFDTLVNDPQAKGDPEAPLRSLEEMGLEGRRVLLAEDQELNAEIATDFLEMTGVRVDWARDGEQAVEMFAASPDGYYSMIFMDVQMPNMNGYEATKAIRAMDREYAKEIPIVAMTANAFAEDVLNCKKAGMNEHITKPIDVEVLARILTTYVKR